MNSKNYLYKCECGCEYSNAQDAALCGNGCFILTGRSPADSKEKIEHTECCNIVKYMDDMVCHDCRSVWGLSSKPPVKCIPVKEEPKNDIQALLIERGKTYGKFDGHAKIAQGIKHAMAVDGWNNLSDSQKEALEMIAHKIARVLNGDPTYVDSWRDICGFSQLIVNELEGK